jgi:hypothetical protein
MIMQMLIKGEKLVLIALLLFIVSLKSPLSALDNITHQLSPEAVVSLITCTPYDGEVYALYGHTAIRVFDASNNLDVVVNYGTFDTNKPNFIYHFATGETDYILSVYNFSYLFSEYREKGSQVCEQVLNLLPEEKERLWQSLVINALPENRGYRYNFFFDNCATRPIAMIEKNINGTINFQGTEEKTTFREAINKCTAEHEWLTLGCDLVLGTPTDRIMTQKERLFLPENLRVYLSKSVIVRDGSPQPIVAQTNILSEQQIQAKKFNIFSSPLICFGIFFLLILLITLIEYSSKKYFRIIDCIIFFIAGIAGCIIFFLSFISVHPCMFPNINLLWLHPLHFVGVFFFSLKKLKNPAFWFHFINFAAILTMCVGWIFVPQHFNIAFIPMIATLWMRSGWALLRKKL